MKVVHCESEYKKIKRRTEMAKFVKLVNCATNSNKNANVHSVTESKKRQAEPYLKQKLPDGGEFNQANTKSGKSKVSRPNFEKNVSEQSVKTSETSKKEEDDEIVISSDDEESDSDESDTTSSEEDVIVKEYDEKIWGESESDPDPTGCNFKGKTATFKAAVEKLKKIMKKGSAKKRNNTTVYG